jgi:hypothetical protein
MSLAICSAVGGVNGAVPLVKADEATASIRTA